MRSGDGDTSVIHYVTPPVTYEKTDVWLLSQHTYQKKQLLVYSNVRTKQQNRTTPNCKILRH